MVLSCLKRLHMIWRRQVSTSIWLNIWDTPLTSCAPAHRVQNSNRYVLLVVAPLYIETFLVLVSALPGSFSLRSADRCLLIVCLHRATAQSRSCPPLFGTPGIVAGRVPWPFFCAIPEMSQVHFIN